MSKRSRQMRIALEKQMEREQAKREDKLPHNDPEAFLLFPGGPRIPLPGLVESRKQARAESFEEAKAEWEKQHGKPLEGHDLSPYLPVGKKTVGWDDFNNGTLTREDLTPSQNKRLNREFKQWLEGGPRKWVRSMKKLGVDDIDIDWKGIRELYAAVNG